MTASSFGLNGVSHLSTLLGDSESHGMVWLASSLRHLAVPGLSGICSEEWPDGLTWPERVTGWTLHFQLGRHLDCRPYRLRAAPHKNFVGTPRRQRQSKLARPHSRLQHRPPQKYPCNEKGVHLNKVLGPDPGPCRIQQLHRPPVPSDFCHGYPGATTQRRLQRSSWRCALNTMRHIRKANKESVRQEVPQVWTLGFSCAP